MFIADFVVVVFLFVVIVLVVVEETAVYIADFVVLVTCLSLCCHRLGCRCGDSAYRRLCCPCLSLRCHRLGCLCCQDSADPGLRSKERSTEV